MVRSTVVRSMAMSDGATGIEGIAFGDDEERWNAVLRRDRAADGTFLYAVRTTSVYCRPSCGSRTARREHVRFYSSCEAAEAAGYRPCKRCRPREAAPAKRRAALVAAACRAIEAAEESPSLDELARASGMSRFHFHREFKALTGMTPKAYADAHRARRVRAELEQRGTVIEAMYGSGFNSSSRFYATSSDLLGMTPTAFRHGGTGETIRFAAGQCWLGAILVAATGKGICAISIGDDPEALLRDLEDQFPRAQLVGGDEEFERMVAAVVGFVEKPSLSLDLPLDVRGSAFQQRVWRALRAIPAGSTASYSEIAASIGQAGAGRAVAGACASNPIAVAIPCHRVVRRNGSVSGYRWGIERKRALLTRESS